MRSIACILWGVLCLLHLQICIPEVIRPYNLDYLDVETMEYYLNAPNHDYDLAVLFYAQWCNNCHAFAPLWDKIGRLMHAGSKHSNIILGLFDCEQDAKHMEVCNQAGVQHYPTIMFYSLSGQTFRKKQRITAKNPHPLPRHSVLFQGNWQYGDAVYDWLRTMSGLSAWHRSAWGQKLRSLFWGGKRKPKKDQLLPLGIPEGGAVGTKDTSPETSGTTTSGTSLEVTAAALTNAEKAVEDSKAKIKKLEDAVLRSNMMMGAMLHPVTVKKDVSSRVTANETLITTTMYKSKLPFSDIKSDIESNLVTNATTYQQKNFTDAFRFLNETDGWGIHNVDKKDTVEANDDLVLRGCVMEISLDYCIGVTTKVAVDWLDQYSSNDYTDEALESFDTDLMTRIEQEEPYCVWVEGCVTTLFQDEKCRPMACPFVDEAACRFLSSCFEPQIQAEYAKVLKVETTYTKAMAEANESLILNADNTSSSSSETESTTSKSDSKGGRGWGFF